MTKVQVEIMLDTLIRAHSRKLEASIGAYAYASSDDYCEANNAADNYYDVYEATVETLVPLLKKDTKVSKSLKNG
jgi:hypothetical protein